MNEETHEVNPAEVAAETMLGDLMSVCLQEIKAAPDVWPKLNEQQQGEVIYRVERACRCAVDKAVEVIASGDHQTVPATVESVTFKDGAKAVLKGVGQGFHDIADHCNQSVLIVIPERQQSLEAPHGIEPDKDQGDLPLDAAA